ncbi:MAG: redox-regulated ATPase YchF [Candidatus Heimdallarchaeota archaeon]|nr:redox-regulated ATPase YchF [Candidatus Heimdallarchaeota archaeon]MBY8994579.1 redox-regulated ATPase YchF [Candidatus Heimdallarchaeota archaeon]
MLIGIVGKPSSGKSTFLNAACLTSSKVGDYPFTTIEPVPGTGYVRIPCSCKELEVECNPQNSICIEGTRLVPINLLDVAGLVPDAWKGRGLGNKLLDDLRRADVLIHVVDFSGSLDADGNNIERGSYDPEKDIEFLEQEVVKWLEQLLHKDWTRISRTSETEKIPIDKLLAEKLAGLQIKRLHIRQALTKTGLNIGIPTRWSKEEVYQFLTILRSIAKPMIFAANKIDLEGSEDNFIRLKDKYEKDLVPCSALAEFFLRKFAEKEIISYTPGDSDFSITKPDKLSEKDRETLEKLRLNILQKHGSTGVQSLINRAVFEIMDVIAIYPVEDQHKYTDHNGNVLPDVYLVPRGTTTKEFAGLIHQDLAKSFINAILVKTQRRVGENYELEDGDIVKINAAEGLK